MHLNCDKTSNGILLSRLCLQAVRIALEDRFLSVSIVVNIALFAKLVGALNLPHSETESRQ